MSEARFYEERCKVYAAAIEKWGVDNQFHVAIEEMSEVIKAITKILRINTASCSESDISGLLESLVEEIADATIMLEQLKEIFCINSDVYVAMWHKIGRLKERLSE